MKTYNGEATCSRCNEKFYWEINEGEKNEVYIKKGMNKIHIKTYNKDLGIVIANCSKCGSSVEINYNFLK